ncbi:hypothetical protein ACFVGY_04370 [Streptomyces sp. NPDC127106]
MDLTAVAVHSSSQPGRPTDRLLRAHVRGEPAQFATTACAVHAVCCLAF